MTSNQYRKFCHMMDLTIDQKKCLISLRRKRVSRVKDESSSQVIPDSDIATWNGNVWKTQRKVSLKMLKDLGFGKTMFEGKILGEFNHLFDRINQLGFNGNSPVKFRRLLTPTVSNIINLMLSGHRYDFNHPIRRSIDGMFDLNNNLAKHLTFTSYMMFFSGIIRLLAYYAGSIAADIRWCQISLLKYIKQTIDDRSSSPNRRDDNFIDMYLKEINATSGDPKSIFTRENLYGCVVGFYVGGTGSTKDTLEWCLLLMAQYPDVQEKMRCEVDSIIGSERSPTHSDKHHMPYTQAVFWEVLRFSSVFPINLPHMLVLAPQLLDTSNNLHLLLLLKVHTRDQFKEWSHHTKRCDDLRQPLCCSLQSSSLG